jgi:hypothetical protein
MMMMMMMMMMMHDPWNCNQELLAHCLSAEGIILWTGDPVLQDERQTQNLQASEWHSVHAEVRKRLKRHVAAIEGSEGGSAKVRRLLDCSKAPQKAGTIHHRSKAPPRCPYSTNTFPCVHTKSTGSHFDSWAGL